MKNLIVLTLFLTFTNCSIAQTEPILPEGPGKTLSENEKKILLQKPSMRKAIKGKQVKAYLIKDNDRKRFGVIIGIGIFKKGEMTHYLEVFKIDTGLVSLRSKKLDEMISLSTNTWRYHYFNKRQQRKFSKGIQRVFG
jgi:hypothetical protein